jgi:major outer membrane protein
MLLLAVGPLAADDEFEMVSYQSVLQTLDNQDQELADLKTRLASLEAEEAVSTPPAVAEGACSPMTCCNACVSNCGWTAGAGIYYLQPRWGSNPALAQFSPTGASSVVQNFDFHGRVAPLVYLGYTGKRGFGFRTQWFTFSDNTPGPMASPNGVNTGLVTTPTSGFESLSTTTVGSALTAAAALRVAALDFELTKALNYGNASYLLSGGFRYAHVGQQYTAGTFNAAGTLTSVLSDGHSFNGLGPTMAGQARYAFPFARNVGIYGRGRGSMLIGQQHDATQSVQPTGVSSNSFSSVNQVVPVAELELGIDWNYQYRSYGFFMQTGFVVQSWFGVGNSANTNIISTGGLTTTSAYDSSSVMCLYGIRTSGGVNF